MCKTDAESKKKKKNHACQFCGVNISDCKLNTLMVMLKALIIFDKQQENTKNKLKTVINMKTVF